jgi:hypothetical protein
MIRMWHLKGECDCKRFGDVTLVSSESLLSLSGKWHREGLSLLIQVAAEDVWWSCGSV